VLEKLAKYRQLLPNSRWESYTKSNVWRYLQEDPSFFANFFFTDPVDKTKDFVPYAWQDQVFNDDGKRVVVCTSRQIGKSTAGGILAIHYAYFNPEATVLVVSKTFQQSIEFIERTKKLLLSSEGKITFEQLKPREERPNQKVIKIRNPRLEGKFKQKERFSRIISVPPTESGLGYTAGAAFADEAGYWTGISEQKNGDYIFKEVFLPTVFASKGKVVVFSTPNGRQGFFHDIFESKVWNAYQFDWRANPTLTELDFKIATDGMNQLQIDSWYNAKFVNPMASYFLESEVNAAVEAFKITEEKVSDTIVSCDLGKIHDQSVIMVGVLENPTSNPKDDIVRVTRIIPKPLGTPYEAVLAEVKAVYEAEQASRIIMDQTAIGEYPTEHLQSLGLPVEGVKFSHQKKSNMYSVLKVLFEQRRIKIPDDDVFRKQLNHMMYEYTSIGTVKVYPPSGEHDDFCDSVALLAHGLLMGVSANIELVAKPSKLFVKEFKPAGKTLIYCDEHESYHWDACPEPLLINIAV